MRAHLATAGACALLVACSGGEPEQYSDSDHLAAPAAASDHLAAPPAAAETVFGRVGLKDVPPVDPSKPPGFVPTGLMTIDGRTVDVTSASHTWNGCARTDEELDCLALAALDGDGSTVSAIVFWGSLDPGEQPQIVTGQFSVDEDAALISVGGEVSFRVPLSSEAVNRRLGRRNLRRVGSVIFELDPITGELVDLEPVPYG